MFANTVERYGLRLPCVLTTLQTPQPRAKIANSRCTPEPLPRHLLREQQFDEHAGTGRVGHGDSAAQWRGVGCTPASPLCKTTMSEHVPARSQITHSPEAATSHLDAVFDRDRRSQSSGHMEVKQAYGVLRTVRMYVQSLHHSLFYFPLAAAQYPRCISRQDISTTVDAKVPSILQTDSTASRSGPVRSLVADHASCRCGRISRLESIHPSWGTYPPVRPHLHRAHLAATP
jgi:hypothetical protein